MRLILAWLGVPLAAAGLLAAAGAVAVWPLTSPSTWAPTVTTAPAASIATHSDATAAAPVALTADELTKASATITTLVDADLSARRLQPDAALNDEQFLRRVFLDLIGRIPTIDEATAFLNDPAADRRAKLVDRLIGSAGWNSHQFTWWADLLRAQTRLQDRYPGQAYLDWIKDRLRAGKAYDAMVRELLSASGAALARGNGATGFYVRDAGMALDNLSTTAQAFLGTSIGCAQCHNHPYDKWTRRDYFAMAAFTNGTEAKRGEPRDPEEKKAEREVMRSVKDQSPEVRNALRQLGESVRLEVIDKQSVMIPLPADYQYHDAKPGQKIGAHTLFGESPTVAAGANPRFGYAAWLTSPENPRFTTAIANRMWKKLMGIGLIEPVDQLKDDTVAANPALMEFLTRLMVSVNYDLRAFQRAVVLSEAYQRIAMASEPAMGEPTGFPGPRLRRLTAEQVWDSVLTLTVPDLDTRTGATAEGLFQLYDDNHDKSAAELLKLAQSLADKRTDLKTLRTQIDDLNKRVNAATPADAKALREQLKPLQERRRDLEAAVEPMRYKQGKNAKIGVDGKGVGPLLRAAELPQPAPNGHFLRVFGQSDRQLIDNASTSPAVPQALFLLNGLVDQVVLTKGSVLVSAVTAQPAKESRIRTVYLAVLSRQPTAGELASATADLDANDRAGFADLAWALINSDEFRFLQ